MVVGLAAAVTPVNPIQNRIDIITDTAASLVALVNNWASGVYVNGAFPFPPNTGTGVIGGNGNLGWRTGGYATEVGLPILNQFLSNVLVYLGEPPDVGAIAGHVLDHIGDAITAPFVQGVDQPGRLSGAAAALGAAAVADVVPPDEPDPTPKRERRGAAVRGTDTGATAG